jgi:hypothetical protein
MGAGAGALERCNTIEECYELMLAYAAKGVPGQEEGEPGAQIRDCLRRAATATDGLAESCALAVREADLASERVLPFLAVLERDARDSLAAMELVLAQRAISSQLVDSLNASIHLRALLTDMFIVGDVLRAQLVGRPGR